MELLLQLLVTLQIWKKKKFIKYNILLEIKQMVPAFLVCDPSQKKAVHISDIFE